jgi:hypothetical protein
MAHPELFIGLLELGSAVEIRREFGKRGKYPGRFCRTFAD